MPADTGIPQLGSFLLSTMAEVNFLLVVSVFSTKESELIAALASVWGLPVHENNEQAIISAANENVESMIFE